MNKSEQINELACSLSKFQGDVTDAVKDTKAFSHRYAELTQMLSIARPLLSRHGLSVSQLPYTDNSKVGLETVLMHTSGQYLSTSLVIDVLEAKGMNTCQRIGSTLSYLRKYAYMSILGFTQRGEDDDAESAEEKPKFKQREANQETQRVSSDDVEALKIQIGLTKSSIEEMLKYYNISALEEMTPQQFSSATKIMERRIKQLQDEVK